MPADIDLDDVERTIAELLYRYKRALQVAAGLPVLFRARVEVDGEAARLFWSRGKRWSHAMTDSRWGRGWAALLFRARWGARWFTRLYVETHMRRQLGAVREGLRLELLGTTEREDSARMTAVEEDLAARVTPLLGWRRFWGLIARLPAIAAAVPVVWVASAIPTDGISFEAPSDALGLAILVALCAWVVLVWPAIRLGFRIKRQIFAGGVDLDDPFHDPDERVYWPMFDGASVYARRGASTGIVPEHVYAAEDAVFAALRRRKPRELPLDLLLSFRPYVAFAIATVALVALVTAFSNGDLLTWDTWALAVLVYPVVVSRNAWRSYNRRPR